MKCREHVWTSAAQNASSMNLWARCINCGESRWNPWRAALGTVTP